MGSDSVTCQPAEVWIPPLPQPMQVLDLATPEGCKAELTYATWKPTGWDLSPRPANRKSNVLPQHQHNRLPFEPYRQLKFRTLKIQDDGRAVF